MTSILSGIFRVVICLGMAAFAAGEALASGLEVPPDGREAIRLMYSGKQEQAVALAKKIEAAQPDHPLGYLIEADALWWKIYCKWSERKYNTIDAWPHPRPADSDSAAELTLADKVVHLAETGIAQSDTAEMELYAGLGYALRARLVGMRYERMLAVRAGIAARSHLMRCIEIDPSMSDAYLGLGLYNYFVDTLSAMVKIMRFFMGVPGGDKRVGLRQLEIASTKGELTRMEARYNMARDLRNYDRDYARAEQAAAPLITEYPGNGIFLLLVGDLQQKLGHTDEAAERFRAAADTSWEGNACQDRVRLLAGEALASSSTAGK